MSTWLLLEAWKSGEHPRIEDVLVATCVPKQTSKARRRSATISDLLNMSGLQTLAASAVQNAKHHEGKSKPQEEEKENEVAPLDATEKRAVRQCRASLQEENRLEFHPLDLGAGE